MKTSCDKQMRSGAQNHRRLCYFLYNYLKEINVRFDFII